MSEPADNGAEHAALIGPMSRTVMALGLELPGPVWDDVRRQWADLAAGIYNQGAELRRLREENEQVQTTNRALVSGMERHRRLFPDAAEAKEWERRGYQRCQDDVVAWLADARDGNRAMAQDERLTPKHRAGLAAMTLAFSQAHDHFAEVDDVGAAGPDSSEEQT